MSLHFLICYYFKRSYQILIYSFILILGKNPEEENMLNTAQKSDNGTLLFNPVFKQHEGRYQCEADNNAEESLKRIVSLLVHGRILHTNA